MAPSVRKFDAVIVGAGGAGLARGARTRHAGPQGRRRSPRSSRRARTPSRRRAASAPPSATWARTTGTGTCTTRSRARTSSATRTRSSSCAARRPRRCTSSSTSACRSTATTNGTIYQRPFGGHSQNFGEKPVQRSCCAADRTGHAMLHTLYQRNVRARTQFFVEWMALDLIRDARRPGAGRDRARDGDRRGDDPAGARRRCSPPAARGASSPRRTNAFINTGDGLGMAARAGIPLEDMEFWQFHPTGVAGAGVLITEGVRGEGGYLLNKNGERFMERYAPNAEGPRLAATSSRAPWRPRSRKAAAPGSTATTCCSSSTTSAPRSIDKRLPGIREIAKKFANVDPVKDPIPVVPTVHYQMGGIPTNYHGEVVVPAGRQSRGGRAGLLRGGRVRLRLGARRQPPRHEFAAPTCWCSARRAASSMIKFLSEKPGRTGSAEGRGRAHARRASRASTARRAASRVAEVGTDMRRAMQAHCGVFRFPDMLVEGVKKITRNRRPREPHRRSATRARCSTPRASRRSSSTT